MYDKVKIDQILDKEGERLSLSDFVSLDSKMIFDIYKMEKQQLEWMSFLPILWNKMTPYRVFRDFVSNLSVVNDAAERNVKLKP